ncbi:VOC family protein [Streptomyces sp. NPDC013978]|uniref:VOC family protein n=1 Tax=Streptomyces sp. NPDC013978 TaxID=3364869 RepID=UPI0036F56AAD
MTRPPRRDHPNGRRGADRQAEVDRLPALGARHADIGRGEQSWTTLVDPEGNEFRVLGSRHRRPERSRAPNIRWLKKRGAAPSRRRPVIRSLGVGDLWHRPPNRRGPSS